MPDLRGTARTIYASWQSRIVLRGERGATAVEYGLMLALITGVIFAAVVFLGAETRGSLDCSAQSVRARGAAC